MGGAGQGKRQEGRGKRAGKGAKLRPCRRKVKRMGSSRLWSGSGGAARGFSGRPAGGNRSPRID